MPNNNKNNNDIILKYFCFLMLLLLFILIMFNLIKKNKKKIGFNKMIYTVDNDGIIKDFKKTCVNGNMYDYAIYSERNFKYKLI